MTAVSVRPEKTNRNLQETDLELSIIDGTGEVLYTEIQHVPVIHSAVSVLVGRGTAEGIPYDAFDPTTTKLLRVKLVDQSVPQEVLELASVPYAIYAQTLAAPIGSDLILDGSVARQDLSAELIAELENNLTTDLDVHRTERDAHHASNIDLDNVFVNAGGNNVQDVFEGMDMSILMLRNRVGDIDDRLPPGNTPLDDIYVNVTGDTMTGGLIAPSFAGNGSALTSLNASNLTSGTVDNGRLSSSVSLLGQSIESLEITNGTITTEDLSDTSFAGWDQNVSDDLTMADFAGWDTDVSDDLTMADFAGWDTDASNDLTTSTVFGGDVTGTYDNIQVDPAGHTHPSIPGDPVHLIGGATTCGALSDSMFVEQTCRVWGDGTGPLTISPGFYYPVLGFHHSNADPSPPGTPASASFDPDFDYNFVFRSGSPNRICLEVTVTWNKNCGGGSGSSSGSLLEVTYGVYKQSP